MMNILDAALEYCKMGMSVIPVGRDKKPLIKWEAYQKKRADEGEIRNWFNRFPECNVGIVTGEISNLFVIDTDTPEATLRIQEEIPDSLIVPCQTTPSGGMHFLFCHTPGYSNRARVASGIDIRTSGGFIVAAPSINGNGKGWTWVVSPSDAVFPELVISIGTIIKDSFSFYLYTGKDKCLQEDILQSSTKSTSVYRMFEHHHRNEDLFHSALQLFKGRTAYEVVIQIVENLGKVCVPPWGSLPDDGPIEVIVESAFKFYTKRERNLAAEVKEELLSTEGVFLSTELEKRLQLSTREEKKNLSTILIRLSSEENPIIKRWGNRNGSWTTIESKTEFMDFVNVDLRDRVDVSLPLNIHRKTVFFPKSIILLAGVTGQGKTLFALNFIRMNWDWFDKIYYFNSEMSPQGINKKISYFKGTTIQDWDKHMKAITKWDFRDIGNKIYPDDINVIDYLEPEGDKPFGIHGVISEVINRLRKGIAFITIQKKPGSDFGTGGIYSVKAASLALNLEWGNISIYKNRFREEDPNPRMDKIDFIVSDGYKITADGDWYDSRIGKNKYKSFEKGD